MEPHTVCRYRSWEAAHAIMEHMQPLTNVRLSVQCRPVDKSEAERGVGDFVIEYDRNEHYTVADLEVWSRLGRCADKGLILALADALRKARPNHPLLDMWMLEPENRQQLAKYRVDERR